MDAEVLDATRRLNPPRLSGRSPLLRLQSDERLIALIRRGNAAAFETLVGRYETRLLAFCRHLLGSREGAEDVLQEVLAAAFNAILADDRPIKVRPWLYRIARNRSLNYLRRNQTIGAESRDVDYSDSGASSAEKARDREEFRLLLGDIQDLPETQRTALVLREMDALSFEQIAETMETTVPSVKSLLVRARVSLAKAAEARMQNGNDAEGKSPESTDADLSKLVISKAPRNKLDDLVDTEVRDVSKRLFGNRLRLEVAAAIGTEPTGQIYGRALAERLGINDNQAAGELKALENAGLLKRLPQKDARTPILFERLRSAYWDLAATFYEEVSSREHGSSAPQTQGPQETQ